MGCHKAIVPRRISAEQNATHADCFANWLVQKSCGKHSAFKFTMFSTPCQDSSWWSMMLIAGTNCISVNGDFDTTPCPQDRPIVFCCWIDPTDADGMGSINCCSPNSIWAHVVSMSCWDWLPHRCNLNEDDCLLHMLRLRPHNKCSMLMLSWCLSEQSHVAYCKSCCINNMVCA